MNYDWQKSDYILDENNRDSLILKIAYEQRIGYTYFYVFNDNGKYSVLSSYVSLKDEFNLMKKCFMFIEDKSTRIDKAYKLVVGSNLYNELFKEKCGVYFLNIDNNVVDNYINNIYKLDLDNIKDNLGLDGEGVYIRFIKYNKEAILYCLFGKYREIKDFIIYLLDQRYV